MNPIASNLRNINNYGIILTYPFKCKIVSVNSPQQKSMFISNDPQVVNSWRYGLNSSVFETDYKNHRKFVCFSTCSAIE